MLLTDQVRLHANAFFESLWTVFEEGSFPYIELKIHERERDGGTVNAQARRAAAEVPLLLRCEEPRLADACMALEFAASREPEIYGPTYELLRAFIMRAYEGVSSSHDSSRAADERTPLC